MLLKRCQFGLEDLHGSSHNLLWSQSAGGFDGEDDFEVVFIDFDGFFDAVVFCVLDAFLAEAAVVGVFNVDYLSLLVEGIYLSGTFLDEGSSLFFSEMFVDLLLVKLYHWLLSHDAS